MVVYLSGACDNVPERVWPHQVVQPHLVDRLPRPGVPQLRGGHLYRRLDRQDESGELNPGLVRPNHGLVRQSEHLHIRRV